MLLAYYEHRMHLGVARYAQQANWILDSTMAHYATLPTSWHGDGILAVALPERRALVAYLRRVQVPVVALTADVEGIATARVVLDNVQIGRMGAEHLLQRGFRNLAFLKCTDYTDIRGREAGFAAAVHAAGVQYTCLDWHAASRRKPKGDLQACLKKQLLRLPRPLGVMAQSDHRAYGLIDACQSAGLAVPEQVAVVGVDNDPYTCEFAPVPITSVDSSREELAYRGAELLDRLIEGETPPAEPLRIPPGGLVLRQSSDILAIDHPEVAKALSFLWKYHGQRIGVDDVVAATAMSRCGLYRAFERHVGRTIRQELERTRLEHGQRLLLTTTDTVGRIARLCGFGSGEQFCRVFAANRGLTPRDFRRTRKTETGASRSR
jgi:LacI family transcriptional regulator